MKTPKEASVPAMLSFAVRVVGPPSRPRMTGPAATAQAQLNKLRRLTFRTAEENGAS